MGKIQINLFDRTFDVYAEGDDEYRQLVADYYVQHVKWTEKCSGIKDPLCLLILAGLELVDGLYKEKRQKLNNETKPIDNSPEELEELALELVKKIDGALK